MRHAGIAGAAAWMAVGLPAEAQMVSAALNADIRSTNPGVNRDDNTDAVVLHMIEGLVGYRENGAVAPLLAQSVDISPDGKTYTFRLRDGVRFHNGAPLTSAEALWSWKRYLDPKTASPISTAATASRSRRSRCRPHARSSCASTSPRRSSSTPCRAPIAAWRGSSTPTPSARTGPGSSPSAPAPTSWDPGSAAST